MTNFSPTRFYRLAVVLATLFVIAAGAYMLAENVWPGDWSVTGTKKAGAGYPAPDFALEQLNGETFRLSEHRGKVVALNFWATWCPPCREEIPDLIKLQEEMREDVLFVGIALDKGGREVVASFAEELGINYPVVIDDGRVVDKYGPISGIPMTFFVDREGNVRLLAGGMVTEEQARPILTALRGGTVPESPEPPFVRLDEPLGKP